MLLEEMQPSAPWSVGATPSLACDLSWLLSVAARPAMQARYPQVAEIFNGRLVCEDATIRPEDLSLRSAQPAQADSLDLDVIERRTIESVMRETNGNKMQASRKLGISRMQLYGRLRKYGLETEAGRPVAAPDTDDAHRALAY